MSYKLTSFGDGVIRLSDNALIPSDVRNRDWREYLLWRSQGNTPQPADPVSVVPELTPRERFEQRTGITIAQLKALLT